MAQCNCSRSRSLQGCKICGDGDVDAPTPSTTIVSVVQSMRRELPHSSITGLSHRDSLDAVDRSADIHCRDEAHNELTFGYPSDDEADLSSLLATYQRNKQYRMSSLRTDLSQPVDPDLCSQLTNSAPQSTNIDNLKWPNPLPSKYTPFRPAKFFIDAVQNIGFIGMKPLTDAYQNLSQRKFSLSLMLILPAYQLSLSRPETVLYLPYRCRRNIDTAT
jgi:hypothetical protein